MKKKLMIVGLVSIWPVLIVCVALGTVFYAKSAVSEHQGKEMAFKDVLVLENGNIGIGFEEDGDAFFKLAYYYRIPDGNIMMRLPGSDLLVKADPAKK